MNIVLRDEIATEKAPHNRHFFIGLGRAAAGAIIFSLPLMMTMEMWNLGFTMEPLRLTLLMVLSLPLLVGLSHVFGFEETFGWQDDTIDAFVAIAVAFIVSAAVLSLFGVLTQKMTSEELLGKIQLQMLPASIGALLAQSQLGSKKSKAKQVTYYGNELFLMGVGALFLSLSVAPTEEILLTAYRLSRWQGLQLAIISLLLMHVFVYVVDFKGSEKPESPIPKLAIFFRFTVVGYAIALVAALFVLWSFGRTDGMAADEIAMIVIVLGFPSAVGAAAARLII